MGPTPTAPEGSLFAQLEGARPLRYNDPGDLPRDVPVHVQAGSAVRRWGGRLVVVQDDVHALAFVEPSGVVRPLALPAGADGRRTFGEALGNKQHKMDLEASVVLPDGRLVVFGSGSKPARERIVVVEPTMDVRVVDATAFYQTLHQCRAFSGSELNVEGAVCLDTVETGWLRLFQRGNGAPRNGIEPQNGIVDLALFAFVRWLDGGPLPMLEHATKIDLGEIGGVPLGFTDAALVPDGRIAFVAGAEDSPDTYADGEVVGCRVGFMSDRAVLACADIVDEQGVRSLLKLEGIEFVREVDGQMEFVVVADMDDPTVPATIATLRVRGPA